MMHPTSYEIDERDANDLTEKVANEQNWANVHVTPVPVSHRSKTTTFTDLKHLAISTATLCRIRMMVKTMGLTHFLCVQTLL
jgi:hypothetical protein